MEDSLFFWGTAKTYKFGIGIAATSWNSISEKKKKQIEKATDSIAKKIIKRNGKIRPGLKTKAFFNIMRLLQKSGWNEADAIYWKEKGWTEKKRPWKK